MKSKYSSILYISFTLILLAGLGALFFRQVFIDDYLRDKTGVSQIEVVTQKSPPQQELINTEILKDGVLPSLLNQVTVFSWDDICGDSLGATRSCVEGNANPFERK